MEKLRRQQPLLVSIALWLSTAVDSAFTMSDLACLRCQQKSPALVHLVESASALVFHHFVLRTDDGWLMLHRCGVERTFTCHFLRSSHAARVYALYWVVQTDREINESTVVGFRSGKNSRSLLSRSRTRSAFRACRSVPCMK